MRRIGYEDYSDDEDYYMGEGAPRRSNSKAAIKRREAYAKKRRAEGKKYKPSKVKRSGSKVSKRKVVKKKVTKKKQTGGKRKLSAYNIFISKEVKKLGREYPNISPQQRFKKAVAAWKHHKGSKSMKRSGARYSGSKVGYERKSRYHR